MNKDNLPTIYCINLPSRTDRRDRMKKRFGAHNLLEHVEFVDAISRGASLIDYYEPSIKNTKLKNGINQLSGGVQSIYNRLAEIGCFASHLKAIKRFLESDMQYGIICEDDIMLHKDFVKLFNNVFDNLKENTNVCMFSYFPWDITQYHYSGKDPNKKNIYTMGLDNVLGAQMYLITREYGLECLRRYDKPGFGGEKTSEAIVRKADGYLSVTQLAIEDCMSSDIRDGNGMQYHVYNFSKYDFNDYKLGVDEKTPLNK